MGKNITEKILAAHAGRKEVIPGEFIEAKVDLILANDITAPIAIKGLRDLGIKKVFDPKRVVLVPDHFTPNKDIASANQCKILRDFARDYGITHYFEVGEAGIEHVLLPEKGLVTAGDFVIGADSHTCTYGALGAFASGVGSTDFAYAMISGETWLKVPLSMKFIYYGRMQKWAEPKDLILYTIGDIGVNGANYRAMEFRDKTEEGIGMAGRFTIANMAIEAGAKSGIFPPDQITKNYLESKKDGRPYTIYKSDEDASYIEVREYDVSKIEPQVAFPHLPSNSIGISKAGNIPIDQVVIGSCTNGRIEDLERAARILKGKKVASCLRLIIIPATPSIYRMALKEGLLEIFLDAGATISPPTCGPCLGGHMGILGKGERALATTNRNFLGRMGDPESEVYLCSPTIAAASAILGRIAGPEEI